MLFIEGIKKHDLTDRALYRHTNMLGFQEKEIRKGLFLFSCKQDAFTFSGLQIIVIRCDVID
jgi:hypothetical protein